MGANFWRLGETNFRIATAVPAQGSSLSATMDLLPALPNGQLMEVRRTLNPQTMPLRGPANRHRAFSLQVRRRSRQKSGPAMVLSTLALEQRLLARRPLPRQQTRPPPALPPP